MLIELWITGTSLSCSFSLIIKDIFIQDGTPQHDFLNESFRLDGKLDVNLLNFRVAHEPEHKMS